MPRPSRRVLEVEPLEARTLPAVAGLPSLHSLPTAPVAIYLDFDGETMPDGTVNAPYDEDGDPSSFNEVEQAVIWEAWRQTAAYFAPFHLNVTTDKPTVPFAWTLLSPDVANVSYIGTFPSTSPQSFVNADDLRWRQSVIAHEIGHQFGLQHQSVYDALGNKLPGEAGEYSPGFDLLHGPIMGTDFAQVVHKWFLGHPSDSPSALQDDIAKLAAKLLPYTGGDGFRPDDHSADPALATPLTVTGSLQTSSGILERQTDVDVFSFTSTGGPIHLAVNRDAPSGVDLRIEVYSTSGQLLLAKDGQTTDQQLNVTLPTGSYVLHVASHGDYGDIGAYTVAVTPLPTGWLTQDVGIVGFAGTFAALGSDQFALGGSGADIWNKADAFRYAYTTLNGDGSIVAQVRSQLDTNPWAKAGVMVRESLGAGARHVTMALTPSNGSAFLYRTSTNGVSTLSSRTAGVAAPSWVKLVRAGNVFTGYRSADGVIWTQQGSTTIAMGTTVLIGLAVTSHNDNVLGLGTFSDVAVTGSLPVTPPPNALPAPTGLTLARGAGTRINVSWTDGAGETGYAVERSEDGATWTRLATTAANVRTYSDVSPFGSMRYFYRVLALDASGASVPSANATIVNGPNAPTNVSVMALSSNSLVIDWRDVSGDNGYRVERSLNGTTFTPIATVGKNVTSYFDVGPLTAGTKYYYRVIALSPNGSSLTSTVANGTTRKSSALPSPWLAQDIGLAGGWSSHDAATNTFTVDAGGVDIWDRADAFHYVYQSLTGNGEIVARVTGAEWTHGWAKAGVMFRETLTPGSKHAMMLVTPGNGSGFQYRASTGGTSTSRAFAATAGAPQWVKLVRSGNTFTGFRSTDGVNWTQVSSATISMSATIHVGLAVTAHTNGNPNTSTFTDVRVQTPATARRRASATVSRATTRLSS